MKRMTSVFLALIFTAGLPMTVAAMSHGDHSGHGKQKAEEMKQHGDMQHGDQGQHKGHDMSGKDDGFVEIGKSSSEGVKATAKIKAYDAATLATMAKMGVAGTHHVMVFFADEKSGADIAAGQIALKVKGPDGAITEPVMLMNMGKGFGADVSLKAGTMYTFELGSKLEDGVKRKFSIDYHNH